MQGDLPLALKRVQLGVGIRTVSVTRAPGAEDHVASIDSALVHLSQVHGGEVDLEGTLVAECLEANVALCSFLARDRVNVLCAQVTSQCGRSLLWSTSLAWRCRHVTV